MRWVILALLAPSAPSAAWAQEAPMPLSFEATLDRYEVPEGGLESVEWTEEAGLQICPTEPVQTELTAFTTEHQGEIATIAIGTTEVLRIELVTPYDGGCIGWGVHPVVAANYIAMLTGEAPRMPLPPEATGE